MVSYVAPATIQPRTPTQAVASALAIAKANKFPGRSGMCEKFVRTAYGLGGYYATAHAHWVAIPAKFKTASGFNAAPAGALLYWSPNHTAISVGGGNCASTDILVAGQVDIVPISRIQSAWGLAPYGWARPYWGNMPLAPTPKPPPAPVETYRQSKKVYRSKMKLGQMNSDSVWNVTLALKQKSYFRGPCVDDYNATVKTDVAAFQRAQGWSGTDADGIVGPQTCSRLGLVWVAD